MNAFSRSLAYTGVLNSSADRGRSAYEADVRVRPTYSDGSPRKGWDQLGEVELEPLGR